MPGGIWPAFAASIITSVDKEARDRDVPELEGKVEQEKERLLLDKQEALAALEERMQRRRQRRISVVRLAGGYHAIETVRAPAALFQRSFASIRPQCFFTFVFRGISNRKDSGTRPQLADGHAVSFVHFFGSQDT